MKIYSKNSWHYKIVKFCNSNIRIKTKVDYWIKFYKYILEIISICLAIYCCSFAVGLLSYNYYYNNNSLEVSYFDYAFSHVGWLVFIYHPIIGLFIITFTVLVILHIYVITSTFFKNFGSYKTIKKIKKKFNNIIYQIKLKHDEQIEFKDD